MNLVNIFEDAGNDVVFVIDGERAYEHVMDKFGHIIEWSGDYMVAPRKVFNQIEEIVYSAGGEVEEVTGFEHPLEESTDMCKVCGQTPCNCTHISEATGLTFMGSPCTKDCSGHKAGYEWSEKRGGQMANSHSQSFNNGAAISVNSKNKQQQPQQQTKPQTAADRLRSKMADLLGPDKAKTFGLAEGTNKNCPPATQDITLNLKNRQKAINEYGYGPLNPDLPNTKFWMKKVDEWNLDSVEEAKQSLCGNCAAFDQRADTLDCIARGIGSDQGAEDPTIDAGDLGYCRFLKFKCAAKRTCDAWVTGGPLTDTNPQVAEGKFNELSVMLADYHNMNISDVKFYGMYGKTRQQVAKEYANYLEEAYDPFGKFDAAEFSRHMEKLRAREELRKTDPMKALVGDLKDRDAEKELAAARRKKPEDDSIGINDPRHPGYAYTQMGQLKVDEDLGDEFGQKELKHTLARARAKFPRAASDTEALIMYVQDQEQQDVKKLDQVNDREDKEIDRLDQEENNIEQRLQSIERKLAGVMETRMYYNVVGTLDKDLRADFGLRKDKNGWYLKESSDAKKKFQAYKAFGSPKLKEYDLSAVRGGSTGVISGADNPVSPIGSVPRGQQKARR